VTREDRILLIALLASLFIILTCPPSTAGVISPELDVVLRKLIPPEEVSVIINLTDKANIVSIKDKDKHTRREKIVKTLQVKAVGTQGPLKRFLQARNAKRMIPFWVRNAIAATVPASVVNELVSFPGVESIELDAVIYAPPVVPAAAAPEEWNITAVKAPDLWNLGFTGEGVVVANMDTGVDLGHPDLQPKWRGGANSWFNPYSDPANAQYCNHPSCCSNPNCPDPSLSACVACSCELSAGTPCDFNGHGTGTMGVMVGGDAGGTSIGVAPGAKWIAVKIFDDSNPPSAPSSIILQGFQWLIGLPADSAPDVVNNSWGFDTVNDCNNMFQGDIDTLKAVGIAVVFSAGNSGPNPSTSVSPANNVGAFAVGATDIYNNIAYFSSRGPSACDSSSIFPHVVAPGVSIKLADLQLVPSPPSQPAYIYDSGTSFSAPHVAGAMALLAGTFPSLTPEQMETAFEQSALPLGDIPNNTYGYGLLDVKFAYIYAFNHFNNPVALVRNTTIVATYSHIQTAYNNCSNGDVIVMQATVFAETAFAESPDFNSPLNIAVGFQGGYDPSFGSQTGFSTIHGTLTISNGTVTVSNLILQ